VFVLYLHTTVLIQYGCRPDGFRYSKVVGRMVVVATCQQRGNYNSHWYSGTDKDA
jgi:hypothetical protein